MNISILNCDVFTSLEILIECFRIIDFDVQGKKLLCVSKYDINRGLLGRLDCKKRAEHRRLFRENRELDVELAASDRAWFSNTNLTV